jgi:hypothetical protein
MQEPSEYQLLSLKPMSLLLVIIQVLTTLFVRVSDALDTPWGWVLLAVAPLCIGYFFPAPSCATYASVNGDMKTGCL